MATPSDRPPLVGRDDSPKKSKSESPHDTQTKGPPSTGTSLGQKSDVLEDLPRTIDTPSTETKRSGSAAKASPPPPNDQSSKFAALKERLAGCQPANVPKFSTCTPA